MAFFDFFRRKKKTPETEAAVETQETAQAVETEADANESEPAQAAADVNETAAEQEAEPAQAVQPVETVAEADEAEAASGAVLPVEAEVDEVGDAPKATSAEELAEVSQAVTQVMESVKDALAEVAQPLGMPVTALVEDKPQEVKPSDVLEKKQPEVGLNQDEVVVNSEENEDKGLLNPEPEAESKEVGNAEKTPAEVLVGSQPEAEEKLGWAARLKKGLTKSRDKMAKSLAGVFGGGKIDEDLYEELETVLITSDMGMEATEHLMKEVRNRVSLKGLKDGEELRGALKDAIYDLIKPLEKPLVLPENTGEPFVIMLAGINGAGKTTSIGKLAKYFQSQGKSVLLAAGDTFRAAAREQLQEWGERNHVTVISQTTGDSAAVCFDAVQAAKARGIDVVLADTAGRLPTQLHLMEEIKKVKRVLQKAMPDAPHEVIVVLDANIGQNAVNQVKAFDEALGLTGLIVTKLDGTAKGGVLAALAGSRPIPVRYIGVGEGIDDLRPFDAKAFVDALLD